MIFEAYKILFLWISFLHMKVTNEYHQKHKEKLWEEACEMYQNLSEDGKWPKKDIKCFLKKKIQRNRQCHGEGNKNLSEEQKQRPVEYMRNYLKK